MRKRLQPVFFEFDPMKHASIECLTEKSVVLPDTSSAAGQPAADAEHEFSDGEFQPTSTFLTFLKAEVAHEMETLWNRSDPTTYPSLSLEWRARIAEAAAGTTHKESTPNTAVKV